MHLPARSVLLLAFVLPGAGCSSESGGATDVPSLEPVVRLDVSPAFDTLDIGESTTLTATAYGRSGAVLTGRTVSWRSSDASLTRLVPSAGQVRVEALAGGAVTITASAEGAEKQAQLALRHPLPVALAVSPLSARADTPTLLLVVNGHDFVTRSRITWGLDTLGTSYVSPSELRATVPAPLIRRVGDVEVTVLTPAPGGGRSARLSVRMTPAMVKASIDSVMGESPFRRLPWNDVKGYVHFYSSDRADGPTDIFHMRACGSFAGSEYCGTVSSNQDLFFNRFRQWSWGTFDTRKLPNGEHPFLLTITDVASGEVVARVTQTVTVRN